VHVFEAIVPVGRYIRGLNSYDLLGNLIPGIVVLVVTLGVFANPPIPDNLGEYALFAVLAFLVGGSIQSVASTAVGSRKHFDWTMSGAEERTESEIVDTDEDPDEDSGEGLDEDRTEENEKRYTIGNGNGAAWKIAHPFVGPLFWWLRPDRGKKLDDAILVNRIWEYLIDTHEIPFRTTSYSVLYHVMSSRVDDIRSPSRAVRMQALRNLHRGMWIASWYASILLIAAIIVDHCLEPGEIIPILDFTYEQPIIFQYFTVTWPLILIALASVLVFWLQAESSEEDYIEYLFADYVVAVASEAENISFDEDATLAVAGQLTAEMVNLSDLQSATAPESDGDGGESIPDGPETDEQSSDTKTDENNDDDVTDP